MNIYLPEKERKKERKHSSVFMSETHHYAQGKRSMHIEKDVARYILIWKTSRFNLILLPNDVMLP